MDTSSRDCFALLDDCEATLLRPTSRLYQGLVREHCCVDPTELDALWARVQVDLCAGLHAVLLADYEWGAKLLTAGDERLGSGDASSLHVLMFRQLAHLSEAEVDEWLARLEQVQMPETGDTPPSAPVAGVMSLQPSVDRSEFMQAIERIHAAIAAGETYQVNYTYRLQGQAYGSPVALYRQLRARQPVRYGALIVLPNMPGTAQATTHVLSCSPELFLRHEQGLLTARPMKGTAARMAGPEGDSETARHLSIDTKNRAENVMIVDLLRNDLGRIAQVGSVKVPELFTIEPYGTVFQMTSTVQARLRPEIGFADVLRATFPCGSITGAPKHRTMQWIAELESTPRRLYCGAIGWIDAPQDPSRCGDFCLSVAIRTLTLGREVRGLRPVRLGIGAGIIADSRAADEFDECRLKARFLTGLDPGFELFETVLVTPSGELPHLQRHLDRMARSANILGFAFDADAARAALLEGAAGSGGAPRRLRLALAHSGRLSVTQAMLPALESGEVKLLIAPQRLPDDNPLAGHKTTLRHHFEVGVRAAERVGAFDSLFFGRGGALVEGGRSSVFVRLDGHWWTPPVADGALPGVMRGILLEDPSWSAAERRLHLADLQRAEALVVCNALRGALPARLLQQAPQAA